MNKQVYAKGNHGVDALLKTIGTLRRKKIDILDVYSKDIESHHSDIFITLKDKDYKTALDVKRLLEKLYCLQNVEIIE